MEVRTHLESRIGFHGPLLGLGAYVLDASNAAAKAAIAEVPNGVYRNRMTLDGYDFEIGLEATMTVTDDAIVTDSSRGSRQSSGRVPGSIRDSRPNAPRSILDAPPRFQHTRTFPARNTSWRNTQ